MDEKKQTMIKANTLGLFIARRNSGKSYLMTHLLYLMAKAKNFNWVVVISPTKHTTARSEKITGDFYTNKPTFGG